MSIPYRPIEFALASGEPATVIGFSAIYDMEIKTRSGAQLRIGSEIRVEDGRIVFMSNAHDENGDFASEDCSNHSKELVTFLERLLTLAKQSTKVKHEATMPSCS